jgi:hypothetical protein
MAAGLYSALLDNRLSSTGLVSGIDRLLRILDLPEVDVA